MTTIAANSYLMASDGRVSGGNEILSENSRKIFRLPDGSVIGAAGNVDDWTLAIEELTAAIREGRKPSTHAKGDYSMLRLSADGTLRLYVDRLIGTEVASPAAIGSGGAFARGAMAMGADPKLAVKVARKLDRGSGGRIRTMLPS